MEAFSIAKFSAPRPMATPVGATGSKVRFARDPEVDAGTVASLADVH
jgi:hypothetical protein